MVRRRRDGAEEEGMKGGEKVSWSSKPMAVREWGAWGCGVGVRGGMGGQL